MADLASTPLDFRHPLWQFHLVDHYQGDAAIISRLHHCIADGLALVQVLMSLAEVKELAHQLEATVNDVLVASACPEPRCPVL